MARTDGPLLERSEVTLPRGTIQYHESGEGEPLVFVHGLMVNADHWRHVVPRLDGSFRCIAPDLPFGSHAVPLDPEADLDPRAIAELIREFLRALSLESATIVGNDTGGAFAQILTATHPDAVRRLVLTPSDSFDRFPPPEFGFLTWVPRFPRLLYLGTQALRSTTLLRYAYEPVTKSGISPAVMHRYARRARTDAGIRRDLRKVLRGMSPQHTNDAARSFPDFDRPVLLVWGPNDPVFPIDDAKRLRELFPDARLVELSDTRCFVPEDRPEALAREIRSFLADDDGPAEDAL